jgi:hypothetical protein
MRASDPIGAWLRDTRAQRRVGREAACACGEARPFSLISGRSPSICFHCERLAYGREPFEDNHAFGKRNSPLTIRYPVDDHRAVLSVAQYRWPPETLQNPAGDPFLTAAARFRGLYDNFKYMLEDCLEEASRLEQLSAAMRRKYGVSWWAPPESEKATGANVERTERIAPSARRRTPSTPKGDDDR